MTTTAAQHRSVSPGVSGAGTQPRNLRILFIGGDASGVKRMDQRLRHAGFDVSGSTIHDPAGLAPALDHSRYDLIICDCDPSQRTGLEALEIVRSRGMDLPFILVTDTIGEEKAAECLQQGATDYVRKDELHRLPFAVERVLQGYRWLAERREAELKVRQSEEKFRALIEQGSDGFGVVNRDGIITFVGGPEERLMGYKREERIGTQAFNSVHPDDAEAMRTAWQDCIAAPGRTVSTRIRARRKDGEWRIYEVHTTNHLDHPAVAGVVVNYRDITDRQQAEESLRASEERYRLLFDRNPQPMWVYDRNTLRFLAVNQAAMHRYGYTREEFLGMTLREIRPPEDVPALERTFELPGPSLELAGVWRHRTRDGRILHVEITDSRLEFGGCDAALVLANDVTDRMAAESALKRSEEKYRDFVENAHYAIYRSTPDGTLLDVNPAMVEMLGYESKEELLTRNLSRDVYEHAEDRQAVLEKHKIEDRTVDVETRWRRKDGSLITVCMGGRTARMSDGTIAYFEVMAEDITERRVLENEFRQAQKMEAVGRLAGGVAHDFNNLLNVITAYAELMKQGLAPEDKRHRHLDAIFNAGRRASELTGQLLAFSRKQVLNPTPLDLNNVLNEAAKMLPRLIGEDVKLRFLRERPLGTVKADAGQLQQVLFNLAVNARDAMPSGGTLTIATRNSNVVNDQTPGLTPGQYALLEVTDSGAGMSADVQAHIFEPFFTTKERGKGTGLGLATVYGIVKQSGGYIGVKSESGVGTTFSIYLPCIAETPRAKAEPSSRVSAAPGSGTVLLVEDEDGVRRAVRELLETLGYTVVEAPGPRQALELALAQSSPLHLLLTDVVMPEMSGRELADLVLSQRPGMKVIFMSGYTDDTILRHGVMERGAIFMQKPFTLHALAEKMREALG